MKILSLLLLITMNAYSLEGFERSKQEYESLLEKKYILLPHKGTYLIPFSYNFRPNTQSFEVITNSSSAQGRGEYNRNLEAEFQVSFMILTNRNIFNTDFNLFVAYTQQSWWQVYNDGWSRQFRESNYAPEIFARKIFEKPRSFLGGKIVGYDFGFIHQSNGQVQGLSRSWNRLFLRSIIFYGNTLLKTAFWYRVPDPLDKDENQDILKYLGYGEIEIEQVSSKRSLKLKIIPGTKYQGAELTYSHPWHEGLRYFVKLGYGHGLSLIDYKNEGQKIGVGVILSDLFTR